MTTIDRNGQLVIDFTVAVTNLGRVPELTNLIIDMAHSGAWRDYETAAGRETWREAELDYFLIACGVRYEDASRVLAYKSKSVDLVPLMDPNAGPSKRRPLAEASAAWHAPVPPSLQERAERQGWIRGDNGKLRAAPIPERARLRARHGMTREELERQTRKDNIGGKRTRELDKLAKSILADITDETERRYLVDTLKQRIAPESAGRPQATAEDLKQWAADIERANGDTKTLAEQWGLATSTAYRRVQRVREAKAA